MSKYAHHSNRMVLGVMVSSLSFTSPAAWAAESSNVPREIEQVLITAEKQPGNLQETPIAVTVLQSEYIENQNIATLGQVQQVVPSLVFSQLTQGSLMTIRGVGTDISNTVTEGGVSLFVDGVYQARTYLQNGAFFDLERIEVLRGPQGTLYGRNSTGGSINIITKLPSFTPEATLSQLFGEHGRVETQAGGSMPLVDDVLAARASVAYVKNDGWIDNVTLGNDAGGVTDKSARVSFLYTPSESLEFVLRGSWQDNDGDGSVFIYSANQPVPALLLSPINPGGVLNVPNPALGGLSLAQFHNLNLSPPGTANFNRDKTYQDTKTTSGLNYWSVSGTLAWDLSPSMTLTSITAYVDSESKRTEDTDGTDIAYFMALGLPRTSEQFTQEINLSGSAFNDQLDWLVGGFYLSEDVVSRSEYKLPALQATFEAIFGLFGPSRAPLPPGSLAGRGFHMDGVTTDVQPFLDFAQDQDTESSAGFAEGTWHLNDRLRLTAGVRYTDDQRDVVMTVASNVAGGTCLNDNLSSSWDSWTYRFGVAGDVNEDSLVYANYSKGFKSGGFNSGICRNEFQPESLYAYELGMKMQPFERQLQLNVAAFLYDYDDMQARQIFNSATIVTNAAEAQVYGLEIESIVRMPWNLSFDAGVMLLNAENESYLATDPMFPARGVQELKGKQLLRAPDWRANIGLQYDVDLSEMGGLSLRYEIALSDSLYYDVFNNDFAKQDAYNVSNVRLTWAAGEKLSGLTVQAFVENLGDEEYVEAHLAGSLWGGVISHYAPPRWAGAVVRYHWGG